MKKIKLMAIVFVIVGLALSPCWGADTVKIGFNAPMTGDNPDVGASTKNAAEMYLAKNPSIEVGGKTYALEFVYEDNEYKAESAVKVSTKCAN